MVIAKSGIRAEKAANKPEFCTPAPVPDRRAAAVCLHTVPVQPLADGDEVIGLNPLVKEYLECRGWAIDQLRRHRTVVPELKLQGELSDDPATAGDRVDEARPWSNELGVDEDDEEGRVVRRQRRRSAQLLPCAHLLLARRTGRGAGRAERRVSAGGSLRAALGEEALKDGAEGVRDGVGEPEVKRFFVLVVFVPHPLGLRGTARSGQAAATQQQTWLQLDRVARGRLAVAEAGQLVGRKELLVGANKGCHSDAQAGRMEPRVEWHCEALALLRAPLKSPTCRTPPVTIEKSLIPQHLGCGGMAV